MELEVKTFTGCNTDETSINRGTIMCPYCGSHELTLDTISGEFVCCSCKKVI